MIKKEDLIAELRARIAENAKSYDADAIDRAIEFAVRYHDGQFRSSGEEYVCHPLQVCLILVDLGMDTPTLQAALLHDVVEDTGCTLEDITREFGEEVAQLVDGVTKLDKLPFSTREEQQAENVRKMLLALSKDVRVIIIKLADRLHNMRTISAMPEQKRRDKAKETMDVYAPLAHRLGMRNIKDELECLSLQVLDPVAYSEIEAELNHQREEHKNFLEDVQARIAKRLEEYGLHPTVSGRMKSIVSTYRKTYMQGRTLGEIYDIYAVRIIVDEVNDCYYALGIVHELYRPIPGRVKDYISTPKANMYQSLHTTLMSPTGTPFEVQIRTWNMHYTAEYGIAAHWKYKVGLSGEDKLDDRLAWVRQFIESQKDVDDAEEIVRTIKTDLSSEDIFVLTPKGDVISLPSGSTVIDFAYAIHSAIGNRMVGAKVGGRIVPLDYQLSTGEIVEILTTSSPDHGPSRDWLNVVKTGEARTKIRTWFKRERREENIAQGKAEFERELSRNLIHLPDDKMNELLLSECRRQHCSTPDDFYAAIGYGGILLARLMPRLKEESLRILRENEDIDPESLVMKPHKQSNGGVIISGVDNCLVKFARCCNPLPGDEIIGFITRGNGVSIHKRDCINVPKVVEEAAEPERWVECRWEESVQSTFKATLYISAYDRPALLSDILGQLSSMHVSIHAISANEGDDGHASIEVTVSVSNVGHLNSVLTRLMQVQSVISVRR